MVSFQAAFTIESPIGVISGTKELNPDAPIASDGQCRIGPGGVPLYTFLAQATFEATLTTHTGQTCSMTGTTQASIYHQDTPPTDTFYIENFNQFFGSSTPCVLTGGSAAAGAAACRNGGYRQYTDSDGNDFRNEGECTAYVARGGLLLTRP